MALRSYVKTTYQNTPSTSTPINQTNLNHAEDELQALDDWVEAPETDTIAEHTSGAGVTVDGVLLKDSQVSTDQINEKTSGSGVTVDGLLIKDGGMPYYTPIPPIGFVYFQGPHDTAPSTLWPGLTWSDVSYEEANLTRRAVGALAGAFFAGAPARLSVSVASGVPSINIVSGGSGYLGGGSGNINLIIAGGCTTQMVANATVTNGILTAINVTTAGVGYTSGKVAVYDGVVGHGDLLQSHWHEWASQSGGFNATNDPGSQSNNITGDDGAGISATTAMIAQQYVNKPLTDKANGTPRVGAETSGAWIVVKKWRRTA